MKEFRLFLTFSIHFFRVLSVNGSGCDEMNSKLSCADQCQFISAGSGDAVGYQMIQEGLGFENVCENMLKITSL